MFRRGSLETSKNLLQPAKAHDIDGHQLIQNPSKPEVSAKQVLDLGERLLSEIPGFKQGVVFTPEKQPGQALLASLMKRGNARFFAKLALGRNTSDEYLSTGQVVQNQNGLFSLELQVLPISLQMLEKGKSEKHSDQTKLMAAAALAASAMPDSLRAGLETSLCSSKASVVSHVTPDHSAPLVTAFEQFVGMNGTLNTLQPATGRLNPRLTDLTHMHGVSKPVANEARLFASRSGVAAGMELVTVRPEMLTGKYSLHVRHRVTENGGIEIMSIPEQFPEIFAPEILAQTSAALAFTAHIIGDGQRESKVMRLFDSKNAKEPMTDLLRDIR